MSWRGPRGWLGTLGPCLKLVIPKRGIAGGNRLLVDSQKKQIPPFAFATVRNDKDGGLVCSSEEQFRQVVMLSEEELRLAKFLAVEGPLPPGTRNGYRGPSTP